MPSILLLYFWLLTLHDFCQLEFLPAVSYLLVNRTVSISSARVANHFIRSLKKFGYQCQLKYLLKSCNRWFSCF